MHPSSMESQKAH
nr:unnamed protein product [Callosobruchus chinensis]